MTDNHEPIMDYNRLKALAPADCPQIALFIEQRALDVFVDSSWNVWFRKFTHSHDISFRRSLQEIVLLIRGLPGNYSVTPDIHPVDSAVWQSFQAHRSQSHSDSQHGNVSDAAGAVASHPTEESNEMVDELLDHMIDRGASDLHILTDNHNKRTSVRMRINGVLVATNAWDYHTGDTLIRSIWNKHKHIHRTENAINHGSFYHSAAGARYMVRITEAPEIRGGTMFVARIRDPLEIRTLNQTGYTDQQQRTIQSILSARAGLVCINGPTNSGKSSTQSSMLALMPSDVHIIEIGDPIETHLDLTAHFELSEKYPGGKEHHLKQYLGSTLRQDPDLLALTEMRDESSARAALQLTSQGKMVITTMHTTDFVAALERLRLFDLSRREIVSWGFLRGFISQRLMPRLCDQCSLDTSPQPNTNARWRLLFGEDRLSRIRYHNSTGCSACNHTGVVSRILIAEAVEITAEVLQLARKILYDSNPLPWFKYAKENGITNIHHHASDRVLRGEIDPHHAERELGRFTQSKLLRMHDSKTKITSLPRKNST